jgi:hypothetical protein
MTAGKVAPDAVSSCASSGHCPFTGKHGLALADGVGVEAPPQAAMSVAMASALAARRNFIFFSSPNIPASSITAAVVRDVLRVCRDGEARAEGV